MNTTKTYLLSLIALALLISPVAVREAQAGIRINAVLRTPDVRVQWKSRPDCSIRDHRRGHRCDCRVEYVERITRRDRRIAKRLAWYTGLPTREVLRLKRMGYNWREIGRWLDVPRHVVRASMESRSWKRYRDRDDHRHARHHVRSRDREYRLTYRD